ncbi:MAG: GyrI-like domain-containing protein [Oscillospiraceae bacterium]|nr:GyrI-like domain-containing protein [Oscillospiraceae bacterium]
MQPKIVKMDKRHITGMFGTVKNQHECCKHFEEHYEKNPFEKADKYDCRVYLWNMPKERQFFYGFETDSVIDDSDFVTIEFPSCEWAIFEVSPAKWWVSGDKDVQDWVANNEKYKWRKYDGSKCQLEYYKEKFFGADNPDSLMEIWYPLEEKRSRK